MLFPTVGFLSPQAHHTQNFHHPLRPETDHKRCWEVKPVSVPLFQSLSLISLRQQPTPTLPLTAHFTTQCLSVSGKTVSYSILERAHMHFIEVLHSLLTGF